MEENDDIIYFDSIKKDNDNLIIESKEQQNDLSLRKQQNYKKRHKGDVESMSPIRRFIDTFLPAVIVSIIVYLIFQFVLLNGNVPSGSMENTINTGNLILTNRLAYIEETPQRGDIIVFWSDEHEQLLVKRVIGVGGDTINLKDGEVYINGELVHESYIKGKTWSSSNKDEIFVVPEGKLFVLGDNRENSGDSRFFVNTYVDVNQVKGKVLLHYSLGGNDGVFVEIVKHEAPKFK